MNCFTKDTCWDSSLTICTCKEVEIAAWNADICRCKCPNKLTTFWLSEAYLVSTRHNRSCNARLVSILLMESVLSASSISSFWKWETLPSCTDAMSAASAKRQQSIELNWMYQFCVFRIGMFGIRIRWIHAPHRKCDRFYQSMPPMKF